ncbi:hypothetical protein LINPERHAP1_LOCUS4901 [Linum perenne]
MNPDKAPGPDGFNLGFYQKFWPIVGEEVVKCCQAWVESGIIPEYAKGTAIVLLPKVDQSESGLQKGGFSL